MKPLSHDTLRGNWATLLLATDKQGKIDFSRQSDEIDILIASKPNGIYSNGTAGEFYSQNRDEFVRISQLLAEKCEAAGTAFQIGASHPCAQGVARAPGARPRSETRSHTGHPPRLVPRQ